MLSNNEIEELTYSLLDCRMKLLWLTSQKPINEIQKELIEHGKEKLKEVNQLLINFNVRLPS